MSALAQQQIEENFKSKAPFLDLGNCGLDGTETELYQQLEGADHLVGINFSWSWYDEEKDKWLKSTNTGERNKLLQFPLPLLAAVQKLWLWEVCGFQDFSSLKEWKQLEYLDVASNQIEDCSFLKGLTQLRSLYLSENQIEDYSFLKCLPQLTSLDLSNNQIEDYSFLQGLTELTSLNLWNNQIEDCSFLQGLTELRSLDLSSNQIEDYSFLQGLPELTSLNLSSNQIEDISFLKDLTQLTSLDLSGNQIEDFSFLKGLTQLTSLGLSGNQIQDISFLQGLTQLTSLNLSGNQIEDFSFLKDLTQLTSLNLSYNQIEDISFLKGLPQLTSLNLSYNQIEDISFLKDLTQLTSLNLIRNQIEDVSFLKDLTQLTSLDLWNNQINDISPVLHLSQLDTIYLNGNNVQSLSHIQQLLSLPNLQYLSLADNALPKIPQELFGSFTQNCLSDLRSYFSSTEFVPNQQVKMLLLGNGMVGKTTLLNRLKKPDGDWETEIKVPLSGRTVGIDVIQETYPLVCKEGAPIQLAIWDFGGQEIYHGTHRLFLSKQALYVVLWALDTKELEGELRQGLAYWLDYIQDMAAASPILLVHSQCDAPKEQDREQINRYLQPSYDERYQKNIVKYTLETSAKANKGFEELKLAMEEAIRERLSLLLTTEIPKKWDIVRSLLSECSEEEISLDTYQTLCKQQELTETEASTLLTFLHRTGFLYYDKQLADRIILNQLWAIEGIYKILAPRGIAQLCKGELSQEDLVEDWLHKGSSEAEAKTFIGFMVGTEICFCVEQKEYQKLPNPTFIVPQYLPEQSPVQDDWEDADNLHVWYQPQFFHKGLVERFLVRLGRLTEKRAIWRNGIRIIHPQHRGSKAMIVFGREQKGQQEKRKVYIRTRGAQKQAFLAEIIQELHKILDSNSQSKPSEKVVLSYSLDGQVFITQSKLDEAIENEGKFVQDENKNKVLVEKLAPLYVEGFQQKLQHSREEKSTLKDLADQQIRPAKELEQTPSAKMARKKARLERYIAETEQLIDDWEHKKRHAENPSERERAIQEIEKLEEVLEDYEQQLEEV